MKNRIKTLFLVLLLLFPSYVHSKGLHFGIISAVKQKVKKLKEKKEEAETKIKLAENTKVLDDETTDHLTKTEDQTYYFSRDATQIDELKTGDIIVGTQGEGFLRKITAINTTADEYVVVTTTSTLEEAFEKLEIDFTKTLTESDINPQRSPQLKKGVRIQKITPAGEFTINISSSVVFYDFDGNYETTDDQIVAEGTLKFKLGVDFKIKIEWFDLKEIKFVTTVEETTEINLIAKLKKSWEKEIELGKIYFAPIPLGPVILVPEATIVIGLSAEAGLEVTTGITGIATIRTGLDYNRGVWTPITDFSTDFEFNPPSLTIEGDIKGYAGPKLALKIYGVVGPYANVNGYIQLIAQLYPDDYWKLYGGLEGIGGVEFTILSFVKVNYSATLIDYKVVIASGTIAEDNVPTVSITNPADGSTVSGTVEITADASDDRGVDKVIFFIDGISKSTDTTSPYNYSWDTIAESDGSHTIKAVAYDTVNQTASDQHSVTVDNTTGTHELPDTGQEQSYTTTYGEDHDYQPGTSQPSYTDNGNGTITDNRTGLMWVKDGNSAGCNNGNFSSWEQALTFCEGLSYAGYEDWRLSNVRELESIADSGESSPAINTTYFPNTKSGNYWTSTTHVPNTSNAWYGDFTKGGVFNSSKTGTARYVRPVREGPTEDIHELPDTGQEQSYTTTFGEDHDYQPSASSPSYTVVNSSVVLDNRTGLMWVSDGNSAGCLSGGTTTWEDSLTFCENLDFGGYSDWRLPNRRELMSIVDYGEQSPAINTAYFPNTKMDSYWTSTTYVPITSMAWRVAYGYVSSDNKVGALYYVRPVRGGP